MGTYALGITQIRCGFSPFLTVTFEGLYPTEYSLTVSQGGVVRQFIESVHPQQTSQIDVRLGPMRKVQGRVLGMQSEPLEEASVRLRYMPSVQEISSVLLDACPTDAQGIFELRVPKALSATLTLSVSKQAYLSKSYQNIDVGQASLIVVLQRGASIQGRVFVAPGMDLSKGYAVKLFPAEMPMQPSITTWTLPRPLVSQ